MTEPGDLMAEPQASRFWHVAVQSGLIDAKALAACLEAIPPAKRTPDAIDRRLARQAVNAGFLTTWQAQQVLAGRWQGLRIDKYLLLDLLGQGGMGRVYLARDTRLNRRVALKILSRERMTNPRALARFRREAKVGAQLQHENLIRVYDEGEAHGVRYLVMEYIEGQNVGHLIAEHGRLPPGVAAGLARQVALGLEHLHQKGLLHRDVNPMNILVDRDGTAKLTDLGLAIDLGDADEQVTRDGATVGTFDYISPEQARHSRSVDIRGDIYSLGCTLYHMLAGRVPFPMPSLPEKLFAHQSGEPEPIAQFAPEIAPGLEAVVRRMMSKAPDERHARPLEVARALEPFAAVAVPLDQITQASEPAPASPPPAPTEAIPPPAATMPLDRKLQNGDAVHLGGLGSDPDLAAAGARPAGPSRPVPGGSDPLGFIAKIDLGPEPTLSETVARSKSKSKTRIPRFQGLGDRVRWTRVGLVAAAVLAGFLTLAALIVWVGSRGWPGPGPSTPAGPEHAPGAIAKAGSSEIAVHFRGDPIGVEYAEKDLADAIRRASGKDAEVILRNRKALQFVVKAPLMVQGGRVTIRGDAKVRPILAVELAGPSPLFEVATNGTLDLEGLTIHVEATGAPSAAPATLIDVHGRLRIRHATVTTAGARRDPRVIQADGPGVELAGCLLDGFDGPIRWKAFPGTTLRLSDCQVIRSASGTLTAGWAVSVEPLLPRAKAEPRLTIERSTIVGAGLLRVAGFRPERPLKVQLERSVLATRALLMWDGAAGDFPNALLWSGRGDLFDISESAWVVLPPNGFNTLPGGPVELKTFAAGTIAEEGSEAMAVRFATEPPAEGRQPADFAVVEPAGAEVGADPDRVGPAAK